MRFEFPSDLVIVTGAGERAFCTGMDVAEVADGSAREEAARMEREDGRPYYHFLTAIQNRCWKPVITAVNGMVVSWAAACTSSPTVI